MWSKVVVNHGVMDDDDDGVMDDDDDGVMDDDNRRIFL